MQMDIFERFMRNVILTEDCWIWKKSGRHFTLDIGTYMIAPRAAYRLFKNAHIPKNHVICHTCDNPKCVNPDHLWCGTQSDNIKDMYK